jgi:hypothetical protein
MNRFTRLALAIVAGIIVGGGISYASSTSSSHSTPSRHASVAPSLRRHFAVFAKTRSRVHRGGHAAHAASVTQPLPTKVAASFNDPTQAALNYEPNAAEAAYETPNPASSFGFWVVPGHSGACIVWKTTAWPPSTRANCSPLSGIENTGMSAHISDEGPELLFGFLPNGARSVTVTNADGSTTSSPVVNNAYLIVDSQATARSLTIQSDYAGAPQTTVRQIPAG